MDRQAALAWRFASFFAFLAACWSAAFCLASPYESPTSCLPPLQPNAQTTRAMPRTMFQAVVTSCWATEYAVAVVASVTPLSDATLNAWLTPAPPGVTDVTFAIELPPQIFISVSNDTGMSYAARNTDMTPRLATQASSDGTNTRTMYVRGRPRIAPPSFAWSHHLSTRGQRRRISRNRMYAPPSRQIAVPHGCSCTNANLMSN